MRFSRGRISSSAFHFATLTRYATPCFFVLSLGTAGLRVSTGPRKACDNVFLYGVGIEELMALSPDNRSRSRMALGLLLAVCLILGGSSATTATATPAAVPLSTMSVWGKVALVAILIAVAALENRRRSTRAEEDARARRATERRD